MHQKWFQPCSDSIWSNTVVLDQIKCPHLVPRQQAQLLSGVHLDHFGLNKCPQPEQAFNEYKRKWVNSLSAERMASVSVLTAIDQLGEAQNQLKQLVTSVLPGNLLPPKERDTFNLDFSFKELLKSLDPEHQGPLFPPVE